MAAGIAPQGILLGGNSQLFVNNFLSRSVTRYELAEFLNGRTSNIVEGISIAKLARESLSPQILKGKQFFYSASEDLNAASSRFSSEGYLSCASCHFDGGHDGRTWDFTDRGEGLRNTIELRGRSGTGHGRIHWSANFDEIQDFENDIRLHFGGTGLMSDSDFELTSDTLGTPKAGRSVDLDALAAYVSSLGLESMPKSPYRNPDGTLTSGALKGKRIYSQLSCQTCHRGIQMTDSTLNESHLHDVSTVSSSSGMRRGEEVLPGIDTPTLRGLWDSAPYLHDGSAKLLEDVFRTFGGEDYQAEDATTFGGAGISDTLAVGAHRGHFAYLPRNYSSGLVFDSIPVLPGERSKMVTLRYSISQLEMIYLVANGEPREVQLLPGTFEEQFLTGWMEQSIEIPLQQNSSELQLALYADVPTSDIAIDELFVRRVITSPEHPHAKVQDLAPSDQENLIEFLLQLDGTNDNFQATTEAPPVITVPDETADDAEKPVFGNSLLAGMDGALISISQLSLP